MTDGNIQAARKHFDHAVDRLCQPQPRIIQHRMRYAASLYHQLQDDIAGTQGIDHKSHAKSQPPIWIDATMLLTEIDHQTRTWTPRTTALDTPTRLNHLTAQTWRPQDTDHLTTMTATIQRWCDQITNLLDPQSVKTITAPCPSCGRRTITRKDSAGETIRAPALTVIANQGCTCQACRAHWTPDRYLFLCRLLGFDLPEGVLE